MGTKVQYCTCCGHSLCRAPDSPPGSLTATGFIVGSPLAPPIVRLLTYVQHNVSPTGLPPGWYSVDGRMAVYDFSLLPTSFPIPPFGHCGFNPQQNQGVGSMSFPSTFPPLALSAA